MIAEVIAVGDELVSGVRIDTNSAWLSQQLNEMGVPTRYHTTVGDDLPAEAEAFRTAIRRADIVLATGGLGPTADDLTREAVAEAAGAPLHLDDVVLQGIADLFARHGRDMPDKNRVQAMFPEDSLVIPNPHGTAPGIDLTVSRRDPPGSCRIFALPGVPAEMREMYDQSVAPRIRQLLGGSPRLIRHLEVKCFGVGESELEGMVPDLIQRGRSPSVGITVSRATITLRITADGVDESQCLAAMQPTIASIHDRLGRLVFGQGADELQHAVLRELQRTDRSLVVGEIGTAGQIAAWLAEAACGDAGFLGGLVLPDRLRVEASPAERGHALQAARDAQRTLGGDLALGVGSFPSQERGSVELALLHPAGELRKDVRFLGHPDIRTARIAKAGLNLVRHYLLDQSASPGSA